MQDERKLKGGMRDRKGSARGGKLAIRGNYCLFVCFRRARNGMEDNQN